MKRSFMLLGLLLLAPALAPEARADEKAEKESEKLFRDKVASILEVNCVKCHNDKLRKGKLSLETYEGAMKGGDSGEVIIVGDAGQSLLVEQVSGDKPAMPSKADPLTKDEVAVIRQWIDKGAVWPVGLTLKEKTKKTSAWWSLQPIARVTPPKFNDDDAKWVRTPIDAFVLAKLREKGLKPSAEADKLTLIRRLYYDLTGLPPAPAEVDAFLKDSDPSAYEKLVDRLLATKQYGERWARHWLDVVHYGDTHGYDKDKLRPNAWPYRDYVIRAFNEDKPYARFVQEQLAGDALFPGTMDGTVALGFIAAGPWDFIGHAEVPEEKIDGKVARNTDRDDMVRNTIETFTSMTVGCARCHAHKFDPISMEDYYSLQAVFAALDRADKPYDISPEVAAKRDALTGELAVLNARKAALDAKIQKLAGAELVAINNRLSEISKLGNGGERPEYGYHSNIESRQDAVKWVQVDLGKPRKLNHVFIVGCNDDFNGIGAGFGFPVRFKIELANDAAFKTGVQVVADHTKEDYKNPGVVPQGFSSGGKEARYIRVTATKLAPRMNDFIFALAELTAIAAEGDNPAAGAVVTSLDSIEAPVRWSRKNLTDGYYFGVGRDVKLGEVATLSKQRDTLIAKVSNDSVKSELAALSAKIAGAQKDLASLPARGMVYAGTVYTGGGTFVGTGGRGGKPREIRILGRGDVNSPGDLVGPGTIPVVANAEYRFNLPPDHKESDRRAALARWITREDHPLTWRSIVNRVWLYHMGRGIVDSPNDFGRMGQLPTHPELLDWLATQFRDDMAGSFKKLHKLIVMSATYRQASTHNESFARIDGSNEFYWRANRRRLEAEAVWDSVLVAAGKLDLTMGGPGYWTFVLEKPEHSPHYQYHKMDPDDAKTHRRAIYRFIVRSVPDPLSETLDCADPSQQVEKRTETITALQALAMMNNKFMIRMAEHFAQRLSRTSDDPAKQITEAYRLLTGRAPTAQELNAVTAYAKEFGLANACRVMFNLNEFVFVD
jgi:mono/diheme cytochrome c family protein